MISILSSEAASLIRDAARTRTLLAFDFDGTLAPIVDDRGAARMGPSTRRLLRIAARLYPCAVVSGRDRADILPRLQGVPLTAIVGNHGAEGCHPSAAARIRRQVRAWCAALEDVFKGEPEIEVEPKALSVAIRHRRVDSGRELPRRVRDLAAALPGGRVVGGHRVLNVVHVDAPTKGRALEVLARRLSVSSVVFVGNDGTAEDAFRSPAVTLGVRVGPSETTAARFFLADQGDIDSLLRALVRARLQLDGHGHPRIARRTIPETGDAT